MRRATKTMAITAVLLLAMPVAFYFGFLQVSAQSQVEPLVLWQANQTMPVTALAISADGSTIVVGTGNETCGAVSIYLKAAGPAQVPKRYPSTPCAWGRVRDIAMDRVLGCGQNVIVGTERQGTTAPGMVILLERSVVGLACGAFGTNVFEYAVQPELAATDDPSVTSVAIDWGGFSFVAGTDHGSLLFFNTATMKRTESPSSRYNGPLSEKNLQVKAGMVQEDATVPRTQGITAVAVGNAQDQKLARVVASTSWGEVWLFQASSITAGEPAVNATYPPSSAPRRLECLQGSPACMPITALDYTEDAAEPRWIAVGYGHPMGSARALLLREDQDGIHDGPADKVSAPPLSPTGTAITALALSDNTVFRRAGHAAFLVGTDDGDVQSIRSDSHASDAGRITNSWKAEDYGKSIRDAAMTRDARHMAVADSAGVVRMFDAYLSDEEMEGSASARNGATGNVWERQFADESVDRLAIADDGTLVAGTDGGAIYTFAAPPTAKTRICFGVDPMALDCSGGESPTIRKTQWIRLDDTTSSPDVKIKESRWVIEHFEGGVWVNAAHPDVNAVKDVTFGPDFYQANLTKIGKFRYVQTVEDQTGNSLVSNGVVILNTPLGSRDGVTDRNGAEFQVTGTGPGVTLKAAPTTVQRNENVAFTAKASDVDGNITEYVFSFGDGVTRKVLPPANTTVYAYPRSGTWPASVRVRDDDGNFRTSNVVRIEVLGGDVKCVTACPADDHAFLPFSPVREVEVTNDGAYAVGCGGSGAKGGFRWWRIDADVANDTKKLVQKAGEATTAVTFCDVSESGLISSYGFDNGKVSSQWLGNLTKRTFTPPGPAVALRGLVMSDDGRWIVTCDAKGVVRVFNTDVQDGPREAHDMAPTCRGLAGVGNGESFVVLGSDGKAYLFRRGSVAGGPKDSLVLGGTGNAIDVQRALGTASRYYGAVGLRDGTLQFITLLGDELISNGKNRTAGTTNQGPVNVTISENEGSFVVYAGYANGGVLKFASSAAKNSKGEWTAVATAPAPGTGTRRVNALDLSGRLAAPQGILNARHLVLGVQNGLGGKFDTIHDAAVYTFRARDATPTPIVSVSISDRGLILAGDLRCTVSGVVGSCVYLLVEPPTSDFQAGAWNGSAVVAGTLGAGTVSTFDAGLTLDGFRTPTTYQWDFDGDTVTDATGRYANFTYANAGTYTVRLTATDDGLTAPKKDRILKKVTVAGGPPIACLQVTPTTLLTLQEFAFDARCSRDPGGALVEYCYSFGDGAGVCVGGPQIRHMYLDDGVYSARVTVRDNSGLRATSAPVNVTVLNRVPTAAFTVEQENFQNATNHVDANRDAAFNGTASSDRDGAVVRYVWDFGDGGTANTTQPIVTHRYLTVGEFTVRFFVLDDDEARSPIVARLLRADDSIRVENITLSHDPDPDNRQEEIDQPSTGRLLVQDQAGVNVEGAKCLVEYYYDGPADPNGRPPLEDAKDPYATQTVTTAANGTASFTVPFNDPDGVYVPGRFRLLVDCGKSGTTFGDTEWHIDARREWWIGPPPT